MIFIIHIIDNQKMCIRDSHESFHYTRYDSFLNAGLLRDPAYDVSLCHIPVSYTHLDVYKRQVISFSFIGSL